MTFNIYYYIITILLLERVIKMKYICDICGFVYDDENEEVKFEDLPDTWVCPICGAGKDAFSKAE